MVNSNIEWEWIIVGCCLYTYIERDDRLMDGNSIKLYLLLNIIKKMMVFLGSGIWWQGY